MSLIKKAIAIIEARMWELVEEERYEEAQYLKEKLAEIRELLGLNPYK